MTRVLVGEALISPITSGPEGTVITIGTFDGIHRGHHAVIEEVRGRAAEAGAESVLVTFEPHPLALLRPELAPARLTTQGEKRAILERAGLDYVVFLPFTRELATLSPREFVSEILIGKLGLQQLVIGYDHRLGRGRSGDPEELRALGQELGFTTDVVGAVLLDGEPISSTRVREALMEGRVAEAARGLGRRYSLQGRVVRGDRRGHQLGFPTANIELDDEGKLLPLSGVYAVYAMVRGERVEGVMHLGPRPTFPGASSSIELHILDFADDIYEEWVEVEFLDRIRGIRAYDTVEELITAMTADCNTARTLFAARAGACQ